MNRIFRKDFSAYLPSFLIQGFALVALLICSKSIQAQLTWSADIDHVSCADAEDGSVIVTVNGGSGSYEAFWEELNLTGLSQSELAAGTYHFAINDMVTNEFLPNQELVITQPEKLTANIQELFSVTFIGACDGVATIDITGGTAPYTVEWSDGLTIDDGTTVTDLCVGELSATIRDANLCEVTLDLEVDDSSQPFAAGFNVTDVSCNGATDGSITVNVNGGSVFTEVNWSDIPDASDIRFELAAGTYTAFVFDSATGQNQELDIVVGEPAPIEIEPIVILTPTTDESCDGALDLDITGGTAPYTVDWLGQDANALCFGTYEVEVTDANDCVDIVSVTLGLSTGIADISENDWSIFPNPAKANSAVSINLPENVRVEQIALFDLYGKTIQQQKTNGVTNANLYLKDLVPGIYFLSILSDEENVGLKKLIIK